MSTHGVEALLMGGQACVLYGAAEFSRDADFAILASRENFERLQNALDDQIWSLRKRRSETRTGR